MKIKIDPMAQLRLRAERAVNFHCAPTAQDAAHDRKRQLALVVLADPAAVTAEFARAAEIEGKTPQQLAAVILTKPDALMVADNARRALVVAVRTAPSPEALRAILTEHGIPEHPADRSPDML